MHLKTVGKPVALHLAVAILLLGLIGSVWAGENPIRSFESYAMGGRVEAPREPAPAWREPAPEILLHIGGRSFDPLQEAAPSNGGRSGTLQSDPGGATGYFIVQFDGPIQPQWKAALADAGVELFDYVPDFAFIARIQAWGGNVRSRDASYDGTPLAVSLPADRVADLAAVEGVKWIETLPQWRLFNDVSADIMGVRPTGKRFGLYGQGQVVGVADTGLDMGSAAGEIHEDFEDGLGNSRVVALIDRVPVEEGARWATMHRTPSATDHFPIRTNAGMAPKAALVFQAVNRNGAISLEGLPPDLGELFEEARLAGAHLQTNSWGAALASAYTTFSRDGRYKPDIVAPGTNIPGPCRRMQISAGAMTTITMSGWSVPAWRRPWRPAPPP